MYHRPTNYDPNGNIVRSLTTATMPQFLYQHQQTKLAAVVPASAVQTAPNNQALMTNGSFTYTMAATSNQRQAYYSTSPSRTHFADTQHVSYDPQVVTYDPQAVAYDPQTVAYDPQTVGYDRQAVTYDPQAVAYDPQAVAYDPQAVAYEAQAVTYDPQPIYDTQPIYDPHTNYDPQTHTIDAHVPHFTLQTTSMQPVQPVHTQQQQQQQHSVLPPPPAQMPPQPVAQPVQTLIQSQSHPQLQTLQLQTQPQPTLLTQNLLQSTQQLLIQASKNPFMILILSAHL